MSNDRSPRDVCSITMGISGLIRSPCCRVSTTSSRLGGFSLSGVQSVSRASASSVEIGLHVRGEPVERGPEPEILAQRLLVAVRPDVADRPPRRRLPGRLGLLADELLDVVVGDLDARLLGDRLERELARDRLGASARTCW